MVFFFCINYLPVREEVAVVNYDIKLSTLTVNNNYMQEIPKRRIAVAMNGCYCIHKNHSKEWFFSFINNYLPVREEVAVIDCDINLSTLTVNNNYMKETQSDVLLSQ